jgi:predicted DNA-binding transcriptional regulator AlpA
LSDEVGIWRFYSRRIDDLICFDFRVMTLTALGVANFLTAAGWPSALLDGNVDADVGETAPQWALRLVDELRTRRYDRYVIDQGTPIMEVDVWTAFWRAVEANAIPATAFRLLELEAELRDTEHDDELPTREEIAEALVGVVEIADLCRVEEYEVISWVKAGELPEPAIVLSQATFWLRAEVEEWARANGRLREA